MKYNQIVIKAFERGKGMINAITENVRVSIGNVNWKGMLLDAAAVGTGSAMVAFATSSILKTNGLVIDQLIKVKSTN